MCVSESGVAVEFVLVVLGDKVISGTSNCQVMLIMVPQHNKGRGSDIQPVFA